MTGSLEEYDSDKYYLKRDENGLIHVIDVLTGETVRFQRDRSLHKDNFLEVEDVDGNLILVDPSVDYKKSGLRRKSGASVPFSWTVAEEMCNELVRGTPLTRLSGKGFPNYGVICKWRRLEPKFDEMIRQAIKDSAHEYFARVMDEADRAIADKDEIALSRLRIEVSKYAAKVTQPESYGERITHSGDSESPIQFVLSTGIDRNAVVSERDVRPFAVGATEVVRELVKGEECDGEAGADIRVSGQVDVNGSGDSAEDK